ncbi:FidL-like protein [Citrobacter sp. Cs237]|uniref:FidL-like protein n=2 Tax=Enterobacteriaceae TaxID=543 RepID=UPI002574E202|nr:FidL-like protein [Citrobacter sp. Cs237]MDM2751680.1 FidL-like protein [Citrobacter sp. Cs237]HBU8851329.1 hypothetical protein [Citrobacter sedlakii]
MIQKSQLFLCLSLCLFIFSLTIYAIKTIDIATDLHCSTQITRFGNKNTPMYFTGRYTLDINKDGSGYFHADGFIKPESDNIRTNRYIFFDYKVKQSGKVKEYLLEKIRTVKGVADNASENEFRRVIPAVKQGTEKMMLFIKPLSQDAHVISSINEPLFICAKT